MSDTQTALTKASLKILRPLVRVLIRNGIACGNFIELVRKAYVDEAFAMSSQKNKVTVSSVSAQTGLSRKEVKRLREMDNSPDSNNSSKYNRAIRVISGWLNDPRFTSENGIPVPLRMDEGEHSFAVLVKDYSGDIPTKAMFDMLEVSHCIEKNDGLVYLINHAYVPGEDSSEIINILGTDTNELIETIDHNLTCDNDERRYQRKVSSSRVKADDVKEFKAYASKRAQALLEDLDSWLSHHEISTQDEEAKYVSLGISYFENTPKLDEEI